MNLCLKRKIPFAFQGDYYYNTIWSKIKQ